ncbi:MAG: hypothetical protein J5J00_13125 [Deltaproteobacteria bacterium]|nr:hypothetical protein [Deltaproteobacteria bacterium]
MKRLLIPILVLLTSCGYSFQGSGSVLPPDVRNIYIPLVDNYSTERALSNLLTESLRDRFERFGVVTVVDDISQADAVLRAKVLRVKRDTRTVTSNTDIAQSFDTVIFLGAELRRVTGPVLWRNPNFQVSRDFGTSSSEVVASSADFVGSTFGSSSLARLDSKEISRRQEGETFRLLADEVAKKIYDEAVAPDF